MTDLAARRQLNRGFSDGFSRAVEIVVTPVVFGFLGHVLDGWLGIDPVLTIGLAAFAVAGIFAKLWLGYDREMRRQEAGAVWNRPRTPSVPAAAVASDAGTDAADADAAGVDVASAGAPGAGAVTPDDDVPGHGSGGGG